MPKLLLPLFLLLTGCSGTFPRNIHDGLTKVEWDYLQSVWGIRLGEPYIDGDFLHIPLEHDFRGRTITTTPTVIGSRFECVLAELNGMSGNFLTMDIDISLWGAERGTYTRGRFPVDCKEVLIPMISIFMNGPAAFIHADVVLRDRGFSLLGFNRNKIGSFSL